jgi:anti-sigma factor RsiW
MTRDRDERISAYLDGELDPRERATFEDELARSPELAQELESLRSMKEVTDSMKFEDFPDSAWDRYWEATYNRMERGIGWVLVSVGAMILVAAGLFQVVPELVNWVLHSETDPWWERVGVAALCVGGGILIVSVLRERVFRVRRDPYRGVKR